MKNNLTLIDFFCGAGGFSEGFRQMGFQIIQGYDNWKPAVDTYNHNFGTNSTVKNILDFDDDLEAIENLPNVDVIVGSPPCVSFSSSNKSGKADKSSGVRLTECFLKIVVVKKYQKSSQLKAWFMENVINSKRHLKSKYTFEDLGLKAWAVKNKIDSHEIAINLHDNIEIMNSADFGSLQKRKRLIAGEVISKKKLIVPSPTHSIQNNQFLQKYRTIGDMKKKFPSPFSLKSDELVNDPQFDIAIPLSKITDHFYDTGIYTMNAKFSKHWKVNHPYMGKMSFPENENKPSRTVTATSISNSRESIIYKSETERKGDGEFRMPTIREAAIYMGFPITFQFKGSESIKWRLVGNAVCSSISKILAKTVLQNQGLPIPQKAFISKIIDTEGIKNLNTFSTKNFDCPPVKKSGAKCRWHAFKDGGLTVTLSNFRIGEDKSSQNEWFTSIQYGTGKGFPSHLVKDDMFLQIECLIKKYKNGNDFIDFINNGFSEKIASKQELQRLFEQQTQVDGKKDPIGLIEELKNIINSFDIDGTVVKDKSLQIFKYKNQIPLKQVFALYGINKITSITNRS